MNNNREKDEHIEQLWYMKEGGRDSIDALKGGMGGNYNGDVVDELASEELVELAEENKTVRLTNNGEDHARRLIRAHRLAERLLYDVLGGDYESGACEFEHTVTPELVDSICTLLGHPAACPHGLSIPEGECCKNSSRTARSSVIPLAELKVGQSARVAYINCQSDQQLHKIDGLRIRPGVTVTLTQRYPSYVIECEGGNIAMDEEIASNIRVWKEPERLTAASQGPPARSGRKRFRWGRSKYSEGGAS